MPVPIDGPRGQSTLGGKRARRDETNFEVSLLVISGRSRCQHLRHCHHNCTGLSGHLHSQLAIDHRKVDHARNKICVPQLIVLPYLGDAAKYATMERRGSW